MRLIYIIIVSCLALISCNRISDDEIIDAALAIEYKEINEDRWLLYYMPQQPIKELKKEYARIARTSTEVMWVATQARKEDVSAKYFLQKVIADIEENERMHEAVLRDFDEFLSNYLGVEYKEFIPEVKKEFVSKDYYRYGLDYPDFVYGFPIVRQKISNFQRANKERFDGFLKWTFINEIDIAYREDYILEYLDSCATKSLVFEEKQPHKRNKIDTEAIDRWFEERYSDENIEKRRKEKIAFHKFYKAIEEQTYDMIIEE